MTTITKTTILKTAKPLLAKNGYEGFSMRALADKSHVGLSSIYHFFSDKDELLKEIFDSTRKGLGASRSKLPKVTTAQEMLLQRIYFQFKHIEDIVFVLKYYLHFRPDFLKLDTGYLPTQAHLHIKEVLQEGVKTGEFNIKPSNIDKEAKVIAHSINGFLLEYYPKTPRNEELDDVAHSIHRFLMRSLTNKEVSM